MEMDLRKMETEKLKEFARKLKKCIAEGKTDFNYEKALANVRAELRYRNKMHYGLWEYR